MSASYEQVSQERQRRAEEAFQRRYLNTVSFEGDDEQDWATIAFEMGLGDFYKRLKDGK